MSKQCIKRRAALFAAAGATLPLTGCITVEPPDRPIEINLTVDIRQEVLVRLREDVEQLIQENPEAFPQAQPQGSTQ